MWPEQKSEPKFSIGTEVESINSGAFNCQIIDIQWTFNNKGELITTEYIVKCDYFYNDDFNFIDTREYIYEEKDVIINRYK